MLFIMPRNEFHFIDIFTLKITLLIDVLLIFKRDFMRKKNSWFYNKVETKFEKHCIAEIIKILQDKNLCKF